MRIPGTPASAAYANDARSLTEQGKSDLALGTALVCSVTGGLMGAVVLIGLGHQLSRFATMFSAAEYFWLYLLGLSCAVVVSTGPKINALVALFTGLLLSTIGLSAVHTEARFTFGQAELYNGISFIPAMIGLFGVSEILSKSCAHAGRRRRGKPFEKGKGGCRSFSADSRPTSQIRSWGWPLELLQVERDMRFVPGVSGR